MAKILIYAYKIDNKRWNKGINAVIEKSELETLRKGILNAFYPSAKQCLFIYEEKG